MSSSFFGVSAQIVGVGGRDQLSAPVQQAGAAQGKISKAKILVRLLFNPVQQTGAAQGKKFMVKILVSLSL